MSRDEREPKRRRLSDSERALWRGVTRSVAPLRRRRIEPDEAAAAPPERNAKPLPAARAHTAPIPAPPKPSMPPLISLDRRARQRLARGSEELDARIDLHGKTQSEAHAALLRFLARAQSKGARTVLVITGKGARASAHGGVLKRQVPLWLRLPEFRIYVLGVDDAHVTHGGEGALYVRLRRSRQLTTR